MAEITTKPTAAVETPAPTAHGIPIVRFATVVDRTTELSDEVLTSLETGHRAAVEAIGRFVVAVEEALPQEVATTSEVAKKITHSGIETTDRLVDVGYDLLRQIIDSAGKSLRPHD